LSLLLSVISHVLLELFSITRRKLRLLDNLLERKMDCFHSVLNPFKSLCRLFCQLLGKLGAQLGYQVLFLDLDCCYSSQCDYTKLEALARLEDETLLADPLLLPLDAQLERVCSLTSIPGVTLHQFGASRLVFLVNSS